MKKPAKVRPLTEFHRNSRAVLKELRRTKQANVLTVNGRAAAVLADFDGYQELLDLAEMAILGQQLKKSLDDFHAGKGISLREFDARMAAKLSTGSKRKRSA
jgi:hypothetical protein